jgi:hypothetical protein
MPLLLLERKGKKAKRIAAEAMVVKACGQKLEHK